MLTKRLLGVAALLLLMAFPASAFMVSFMVVETGLGEEASSVYAGLWEGGLMEAFFDAGHIVTNAPATRLPGKPANDLSGFLEDDFNDAVSGGAEYFILGYLEYQVNRGAIPVGMELKLYKTDSRKLLFEHKFPAGSGKDVREEIQIARNAGLTIISQMKD